MLQLFNWELVIITPIHFTASLLGMGVVFEDDRIESKSSSSSHNKDNSEQSNKNGGGERKFQPIDMRAVKCVKRYV